MSVLAAMTWTQSLLTILMLLACLLLIVVILLQKGRGEGLAGALGGGGGGGAFGTKTGDLFTWVTVVMAFVVLLLSVVSNYAFDPARRTVTPDAALLPEDTQELPAEPEGTPVDVAPIPPPATEGGAAELPTTADDQPAPAEAADEAAPGTEPGAVPADEPAPPAAGDQPPPSDEPPTEERPNT